MAATEQVVEEVAEHIEEVADATRKINSQGLGFFFVGVGAGVIAGFILGYRFNREKIKAEAFRESEKEIQEIREQYKTRLEEVKVANRPKPPVEDIVQERGYSVRVEDAEIEQRPLKPVVPVHVDIPVEAPELPRQYRTFRTTLSGKDKMEGWSYPAEMVKRTPDRPYIIHQDEFATNESGFTQLTYVYYVEDDVLTGEEDEILQDRDKLIGGNETLSRFGHGTDDYNMLYVRNPVLELEIELCRSPGSYEEEVLGMSREPEDEEQA